MFLELLLSPLAVTSVITSAKAELSRSSKFSSRAMSAVDAMTVAG